MCEAIKAALRRARRRDGAFDIDKAVNGVFARPGQKYAFLFNQNARRTNLQIAELLSLIRCHTYRVGTRVRENDIEFTTFDEVKRFLQEVMDHGDLTSEENFDSFVENVSAFMQDKILMEALYGSASIFLPMHLTIDVDLICGESGYIHSCGDLLILRNAEKVTEYKFKKEIRRCIKVFRKNSSKFLIVPFCHEDFSPHDRETTPFLQYGLDDVKLNMSKAFIGATKLYDLLEIIGEEFGDHLSIAPAGDFRASGETFKKKFPDKDQQTIFLITDNDRVSGSRFPGMRKFYVLYLQRYKNNNSYHLYDENKPGWASHTTLPHSLAGAMINVARPWFADVQTVEIADPFGGAGTVFFEAQKIAGMNCRSSDRAPIFEYVVKDNAKFFSMNPAEKEQLREDLSAYVGVVPDYYEGVTRKSKETPEQRLGRISKVVRDWAAATDGDFLKLDEAVLKSGFDSLGSDQIDRLLAYVGLRASVRGVTDIARGTASWPVFFKRELTILLQQMENESKRLDAGAQSHPRNERMLVGHASYSASTTPGPPEIERHDLLGSLHFERSSVENLPHNTYDAIITDPPYGFNTDEDYWEMASFVHTMIESLVRALKPAGGQLILAAPSVSFSGKGIMPFVRSDYLAREIVQTCARIGRECVKPVVVLPANLASLQPPYYWVAEKSLERRILHFWIRAK